MVKTLGRGLSSLIPKKTTEFGNKIKTDNSLDTKFLKKEVGILELDIDKIEPNSRQPRKNFPEASLMELADSIKEYGIIQPLVVQKITNADYANGNKEGDRYELIVGERRLRASKKAGLVKVPVIVRDYDEQKKLEVAIVENVQREDLDPIEKAIAYKQLKEEFGLTQESVAKRVGKSRPVIANTMRMLELPEEVKEGLSRGSISEGHANIVMGLSTEIKQKDVFRKIVDNKWSVAETSKQVRKLGGTKESRIKSDYKDNDREMNLRNKLNTKVEIKRVKNGGKIVIDFSSDSELDSIINKF